MRESSPIETPGSILLERIIAEAAISETLVAGIEQRCLRPTSPAPVSLMWSRTSLDVPKCKNNRSPASNSRKEDEFNSKNQFTRIISIVNAQLRFP